MGITDTRSDPRARRVAAVLRGLGLVLLLVGAAGYLLPAGPVHWTALIPAALGAMALAASTLARWPVAAAAVGAVLCLVALMGGGSALAQIPALLAGEAGAAVASRSATALAAIAALAALAFVPWRRAA
ncbi:MAG TPA: hypothetical protein VE033_11410 [Acetobacteraceae bacterium]|nr:hypothetical protein [Acetobacteraceae bacterium]